MTKATDIEKKIVFGLGVTEHDGARALVVGIPKGAWKYMRDGKTCHFDLTSIGLPFKFILFGADTHDAARKLIEQGAAARGETVLDMRREDFSIKDKPET